MSDLKEARAVRYLLDAINDKFLIEPSIEEGIYSQALFHAQQACEKSAKACLSLLDILITDEHIYTDYVVKLVVPNSKDLKKNFRKLMPDMSKLETYYIPSRYGVDRAGKIHYRKYNEKEVLDLCKSSLEFLELCFKFIEERIGKQIPRQRKDLEEYFLYNYREFIRELG